MAVRKLTLAGGVIPLTDVVAGLSITQGRSDPQQQAHPPEMSFTLRGQLNIPGNTPVLFDVGTYRRFTGFVSESTVDRLRGVTQVTAVGDQARLARFQLSWTSGGTWPAETFDARMTRLRNLWINNAKTTLWTPSKPGWEVVAENVEGKNLFEFTQWHASGCDYTLNLLPEGAAAMDPRVFDHANAPVINIPADAIIRAQYLDTRNWRIEGIEITNSTGQILTFGDYISHHVETPLKDTGQWGGPFSTVMVAMVNRWEPPIIPGGWPVPNPGTYRWVPDITVRAGLQLEEDLCWMRSSITCVSIPMDYPGGSATQRWVVEGWRETYEHDFSTWDVHVGPVERYNAPTAAYMNAAQNKIGVAHT